MTYVHKTTATTPIVGTTSWFSKNCVKPKQQTLHIDPEVEELASLLQQSGMSDAEISEKIGKARGCKMSVQTIANVRELTTVRPSSHTLIWLAWAIGYERSKWTKIKRDAPCRGSLITKTPVE